MSGRVFNRQEWVIRLQVVVNLGMIKYNLAGEGVDLAGRNIIPQERGKSPQERF
jgi:hypothetical protein